MRRRIKRIQLRDYAQRYIEVERCDPYMVELLVYDTSEEPPTCMQTVKFLIPTNGDAKAQCTAWIHQNYPRVSV
jgi:hypothetical protein